GLILSSTLYRSFDQRSESQRLYRSASADTIYDYRVNRSTESVTLGGVSGLNYRISPSHSLHLRGLYTNSADDEVRTYQGYDHNQTEATTGQWAEHLGTRLLYIQRSVLSGTLEGDHDFPHVLGARVNWQVSRSSATRLQPDRREYSYDHLYHYDAQNQLVSNWRLSSTGSREFGDLRDHGSGTTIKSSVPFRLRGLGPGGFSIGYDRQVKRRDNFYRRFVIHPNQILDPTLPPDSIFALPTFDGS